MVGPFADAVSDEDVPREKSEERRGNMKRTMRGSSWVKVDWKERSSGSGSGSLGLRGLRL